ncbi:ATP-binding protein [Clostridium fungisolvens]|uniref:ATP-dependent zinc metalloprotease FtsH n=1 Tax=Clostridium fungisolvens TaxID=1604897 RepID=A0A6V8SIT7_9CLOT|nr:AAA family ATPase [Clostridium fungisolvens]GFP76646.1 ATP-dependent zinc metalloprotease FtsH [Clostridium fungisolvens]
MPIDRTPLVEDNKEKREKAEKQKISFLITNPKYTFDDIVLPLEILEETKSVIALDKYSELIYGEWGLSQVMKSHKNISINLYGCSGTGKSMTAQAIAAELNKKILMVNYSEIESKYVGETSKNLVSLFESAEKNDAVIIFDEADALLSRRVTAMHSATDVSVNQTRNVLLKILDDYQGVVIFTTNFIQNFDSAFMRRILSHIKFDMPNEEMRKKLWDHYLVDKLPLSSERNEVIAQLAEIEDITGSDVSTAVLKAAVKAALNGIFKLNTESIKEEINKIVEAKKAMKDDNFTVTTKKVSESYVKEKLEAGGIINGDN